MRKHFLILMLMALLPFTAVAQELQSIEEGFVFTLGSTTAKYNGQVPNFTPKLVNNNLTTPVELTYGTDYELEFYKNDVKLDDAPSAIGSYIVKCHGIGSYTGYTANSIAVVINKAKITVTIGQQETTGENPVWTFKKNYLEANPAIPAVANWTFAVDNGETLTQDQIKAKLTIPATPTYTYTGTDANATKAGVFLGTATAGYSIEFPGIVVNDDNKDYYEVDFTARSMKICQVELAAASNESPFTYSTARTGATVQTYTYSGTQPADAPTVKYKWGTGTNDVYTLTANDVVVKYYDATPEEVTPRNAGTYTAKIYAGESGNFVNPATPGIAIDDFGYTINRAQSLTVLVNPISRAYNAKAFDATEAKFTISGWVPADAGTKITGLTATAVTAFEAKKGEYEVKLTLADETNNTFGNTVVATRSDESTFNPSDNYEIIPFGNTWTITAAPLTFEVGEKTIQSGTVPTTDGVDFEVAGVQKQGGVDTNPLEAVKDAFKVVLIPEETSGQYADVNPTGYDAFTVERKVAADYTGDATAQAAAVTAANAIVANYSWTDASITKGKLKVTGIGFNIMPVASDLTYGEAFEPAYFAYNGTTQVTLSETETNKVNYIVTKGETTYSAEQFAQLPVGEYTVSIDMTNMADLLPSANYSVDQVTPQSVTFNVSQKELTLAIREVTELHVGDTQSNLQDLYPIDNTVATGILASDEEKVKFIFSFDTDKVTLNAETGKIEAVTTADGAIKIAFDTTTDDDTYKNYKFPAVAPVGTLTLSNVYSLDLSVAEGLAKAIEDAADNGNLYTVKMPNRTLKAGEWYPMVLPFKVKTVALVNALRRVVTPAVAATSTTAAVPAVYENVFAVVNLLDKSSTASNVSFKLQMKEIPANEPFLIKVAEDINLQDADFAATVIDKSTPEVGGDDYAGNYFKGVYAATDIQLESGKNMVGFMGHVGEVFKTTTLKNKWYSSETAKTINPLEAYLVYATIYSPGAQAPMVTVEDYENGTTVIKNLNMDTMKAYAAEGWYTLDGIKLQSIPTEKGIYINNGKKVVVK